jgi:hypothetical protein
MSGEQESDISIDTYTETAVIVRPAPALSFRITFADWDRLREKVNTMPQSSDRERNLAWACVGIFAGDILTALTWFASFQALSETSRRDQSWLAFVFIAIGVLSAAVAYLAFSADSTMRRLQQWGSQQVLHDMDGIASRYPRTAPILKPAAAEKGFDPDEIPF